MRFRLTGASARSDSTPRTDNPAVDDCERKLSNLTSAAHSSRAHLHARLRLVPAVFPPNQPTRLSRRCGA